MERFWILLSIVALSTLIGRVVFFWLGYWARILFSGTDFQTKKFLFSKCSGIFFAVLLAPIAGTALFEGSILGNFVGWLLVPPLGWVLVAHHRSVHRRQLEDSGLTYFHALNGLIRSGLGLPSALFQLAQSESSDFGRAMKGALLKYEQGQGLEACLTDLEKQLPTPLIGACLKSLQLAYRQGLALAPLLDQMVPLLEMELDLNRRVEHLRHSALAQAAVAFSIPWLLFLVLRSFQPEVTDTFLKGGSGLPILGGVLLLEMAGARLLWQCARFL